MERKKIALLATMVLLVTLIPAVVLVRGEGGNGGGSLTTTTPTAITVTVGNQIGTLTAGTPGQIAFTIITTGVPDGIWDFHLSLPQGISPVGMETNYYEYDDGWKIFEGRLAIVDGIGTLMLAGDSTTVIGRWSIDFLFFVDEVTEFTLTISPTGGGTAPSMGGAPSSATIQSRHSTIPVTNSINIGTVSVNIRRDGTLAIISLPSNNINEIISRTTGSTVTFNLSNIQGITEARLPRSAMRSFAEAGLGVQILLPQGSVHFSPEAALSAAQQARRNTIYVSIFSPARSSLTTVQRDTLRPNDVIYRVRILSGNQIIRQFDGDVTVNVRRSVSTPFGVWHLDDAGVLTSVYSAENGPNITFVSSIVSIFVIGSTEGRILETPIPQTAQEVQPPAPTPTPELPQEAEMVDIILNEPSADYGNVAVTHTGNVTIVNAINITPEPREEIIAVVARPNPQTGIGIFHIAAFIAVVLAATSATILTTKHRKYLQKADTYKRFLNRQKRINDLLD